MPKHLREEKLPEIPLQVSGFGCQGTDAQHSNRHISSFQIPEVISENKYPVSVHRHRAKAGSF